MKFLIYILFTFIFLNGADISSKISFYKDSTKQLQFQDIQTKEFKLLNNNYLNFGLTRDNYWIKIEIKNNTHKRINKILHLDNPSIDKLNLYEQDYDKPIVSTGDVSNLNTREIEDIDFIFNISILANQTKNYYLKIYSKNPIVVHIDIDNKKDILRKLELKKIFLAIFFGFILSLVIYNLILYFTIREKVYLYYVLFQLSLFFMLTAISGFGYYFLWQNNVFLNEFITKSFDDIGLIFAILFSKEFLKTNKKYQKTDKILNIFIFLLFINMISTGTLHDTLVKPVMLGAIVIVFYISILALLKDKTITKYYFFGWFSLMVGATLMLGQNFGWLEVSFFTKWSLYISSMLEAILFSVSLAQRINILKDEKKKALKINQKKLKYEVKKQTSSLNKALLQKDILLKEVHHRVKNNLQIVSSFISLANMKRDKDIKNTLTSLQDRIKAISLLHECLYKNNNLSNIDMLEYIENLMQYIQGIYRDKNIKFIFEIDNIKIDFDKIITIGSILNEIVTNSIKYAFDNTKTPTITIKLTKGYIKIEDNGCGFDIDKLEGKETMGLKLIYRLVEKQLNGKVEFKSAKDSTTFKLIFKK